MSNVKITILFSYEHKPSLTSAELISNLRDCTHSMTYYAAEEIEVQTTENNTIIRHVLRDNITPFNQDEYLDGMFYDIINEMRHNEDIFKKITSFYVKVEDIDVVRQNPHEKLLQGYTFKE